MSDSFRAKRFAATNQLAVLRRQASENYDHEEIPEGVTKETYFAQFLRAKAAGYGNAPLRRLLSRNEI